MSSMQKSNKRIAVIMCAWKRAHRFERTLQMLAGQDDLDFDFYVWNNNPENNKHLDEVDNSYDLPYKLTIHHSEENKKGFGRFYWAQQLTDDYDYFVFLYLIIHSILSLSTLPPSKITFSFVTIGQCILANLPSVIP